MPRAAPPPCPEQSPALREALRPFITEIAAAAPAPAPPPAAARRGPAAASGSPKPATVLYTAVFLSEASRQLLLRAVPAALPNVQGDHVTLAYEPSPDRLEELVLGRPVTVKVCLRPRGANGPFAPRRCGTARPRVNSVPKWRSA